MSTTNLKKNERPPQNVSSPLSSRLSKTSSNIKRSASTAASAFASKASKAASNYKTYQGSRTGQSFMERHGHLFSIFVVLTFYAFLPVAFPEHRWVIFMGAIALTLSDLIVGRSLPVTLMMTIMHFAVAGWIYSKDWIGSNYFITIMYALVLYGIGNMNKNNRTNTTTAVY